MGILKHVPKQIGDRVPKVYFSCHKDDFKPYFKEISEEIMNGRSCAVFYDEDYDGARDKEFLFDLSKMNLFVMPITTRLLTKPNRALDEELAFALEHKIPVLPLMQESGLEELFNKKFGDLQFLDKYNIDSTAISYDEKLKKYLSSVLLDDKTIKRIRAEFDAQIFLSYRKKDRIHANRLMRLIHKNDFCRDVAIWYDEFLTPGENFNKTIAEALNKSGLFVLAVTPSLLEPRVDENGVKHKNYIEEHEYPMAVEAQKPILPTELVYTDKDVLAVKYANVPDCVDANDESALTEALLNTAKKFVSDENDNSPEHNYLIGLAYLDGIDVERDYDKALEMITFAAENEFPDATIKLISMYYDGIGVSRDENEVRKWSEKLSDYYFKNTFSNEGNIKSADKIEELFANYNDRYWAETIKRFLVSADKKLPLETIKELYKLLTSLGICEYTLLFDSCKEMEQHQEEAQSFLVGDILTKSSNGTYPPYGPLFWYVPEYELYEPALLALDGIKGEAYFTKALALTRDVCWIFGHYNDVSEITKRVDGNELFASATLTGVRRGICELFYTGNTDETDGDSIYPRCFNLAEAKNWKEHGQGILGRMNAAFEDELGLYSHEMFSELDGEYIGIVSAPYDKERLETVLPQKSCKKLCGLFLSPAKQNFLKKLTGLFLSKPERCSYSGLAINDRHLKTVYIPENTIINEYHSDCRNFSILDDAIIYFGSALKIPDNVTEIGWSAFLDCAVLTKITIPNSVTAIGQSAFCGCTALKEIIIPDSVMYIGGFVFCGCTSLKEITIPNSVTVIRDYAFKGCTSLKEITISNNVTAIRDYAFSDCAALESITILNIATAIGEGVFWGCTMLKNITIPDSVTVIEGVFCSCTALKEITIPNSVTVIGDYAFKGCTSLEGINIPNSVTVIGDSAFSDCAGLKEIAIPNSVTVIGWSAFEDCAALKEITIPNSVKAIGKGAFKGCMALKLIENCPQGYGKEYLGMCNECEICFRQAQYEDGILEIPQGTNFINPKEFAGRRELHKIIIPNSVTVIGDSAFSDCAGLKEITIPNSVTEIGRNAFCGCRALKQISIPSSVKVIENGVFCGCVALKDISIPNSVLKVESFIFFGCAALENITIPNSVTEIGMGAFKGCTSLKEITIPDSVTVIAWNAFEDCATLKNITIPNRVKLIGHWVFKGCVALENITIPNSVTEIGWNAFEGCVSLTEINIPDSVTVIEGVFCGCTALKEIAIPNSVTEIGRRTFKDCTALKYITIPNSVREIGDDAFDGCTRLKEITISRRFEDELPRIFSGVDLSKVTVKWI